jgi:undecaprenyl-diphosphatase
VLAAIVWGLIQGLTEFLPVSSSGHLVIIPAFLNELGFDIEPPSLAVSAVLHLGTLAAVLIYFRTDVAKVLKLGTNAEGRKIALLVGIGTIPALVGVFVADDLDEFQSVVSNVGWTLIVTGLILVFGQWAAKGARDLMDGRVPDAIIIGVAQAFALIPGISRSGITIAAGNARNFNPLEAARFSFLLGIPAIAGGGLTQIMSLSGTGDLGVEVIVGGIVAGLSGYAAIALFLSVLRKIGLLPFAIYCFIVGGLTVAFL